MNKEKLLKALLISGIFFLPSTISNAQSLNKVSEADLIRMIENYSGKEIILEDGIVLNLGENFTLPTEEGFKIDESKILDIEDGQLKTKNLGSTFIAQELDNKVYILEVLVTENDLTLNARGYNEKATVDRNYYKIFLDPGHGGYDNGAVQNGFLEDEINLKIAKKVEKLLQSKGIEVKMSRYDDTYVSLSDRTLMANKEKSDIFVSIHQNSATSSSANGIETFHYQPRLDSKELATDIQNNLISSTKATNRGVKTQNFAVIKAADMSSSLVECGFISNLNEGSKLNSDSYQNTIATSIANGIIQYLKDNVTLNGSIAPEQIIKQGIVTTDSLNVRSGPSTANTIIGSLSKNSKVDIVGTSGAWYKIKFKNTYAYVHSDYINIINDNNNDNNNNNDSNIQLKQGIITTDSLNVRSGPSTATTIIGSLSKNSKVDIVDTSGVWYKIKFKNTYGYVHSDYINIINDNNNNNNDNIQVTNGTVITYDLNVRSSASYSSSVLGVVKVGSSVSVIENLGEWSKIKYNNYIGYVLSKYISCDKEVTLPSKTGTVITYDLNVRDSAAYSANVLGVIKIGSSVSVIENLGEWSKIKYNNTTGYVLSKYIEYTKPAKVITYDLNVRNSAAYSANVLGVIKVGSSVSVIENLGEWSKVKYNNTTGYVLSKYLKY